VGALERANLEIIFTALDLKGRGKSDDERFYIDRFDDYGAKETSPRAAGRTTACGPTRCRRLRSPQDLRTRYLLSAPLNDGAEHLT